jgi:predicted metal-dependent phosphoesterase TrpH
VSVTAAAATARYVDLHAHSTASDGALPPEGLIAAAVKAKLSAIALTDHDTLAGVPAALAAAPEGLRVVPGVELSLFDGDREVHMLGLHIEKVAELEHQLIGVRDTRRTRAEEIVAKLNSLGVPVTIGAVFAEAGDGAVGRPHIAKAIIAGGWVRDQREAFDRYLGGGKPANVEKFKLSAVDGIRLIHEAGGIAVFAHPSSDGTRERVESLVAAGVDGLEVKHPSHSNEDMRRIQALADHFGLVTSGGSDWHGATNGPRVLGVMQVPPEWLERQDARVEEWRSGRRTVASSVAVG